MRAFAHKADRAQPRASFSSPGPGTADRGPAHPVLSLQRTMGNHGVRRLLQGRRDDAQAKVSAPGDLAEHEADGIARHVLAAPAHDAAGAPPGIQPVSRPSNGTTAAAPPSVEHAVASAGRPLEPALRRDMEQRFGRDFSGVRVHVDAAGEQSARDVNANAYTLGHDIVFAPGRFAPWTDGGRRLLAHELAHVVQQSGAGARPAPRGHEQPGVSPAPVPVSASGPPVVQRDKAAGDTGEEGRVLTVVIRAPDDVYTQNVTDYVRNTLNDKNIVEVDNLQEIFPYLEEIKKSKGPKLKKIRLIAHGSTIGGIKMKLPGKSQREFVNPDDLEKMAQDQKLRTIAAGAMDTDATVEFYGCYVGGSATTEAAISTMFQSEFRSPDEALHTEEATFVWNNAIVTSTATVDEAAKKDKKAAPQFENWLLKQHKQLAAAGDVPDAGTRAERIAVMRDLFDRSKGRIKQLIIEKKGGGKVRPSDKSAWASEWRKWKVN
jgi:uncharacterized protein DUF4157